MPNFKINKITQRDVANLPFAGLQEWMRSVNRAVNSGVYTPTLTNVTNVTSSTAYECQYMQVGDVVTVSGKMDIQRAAPGDAEIDLSLPIPSNFTAEGQCGGTADTNDTNAEGGGILASVADNRARMRWNAAGAGSTRLWAFIFTYRIL